MEALLSTAQRPSDRRTATTSAQPPRCSSHLLGLRFGGLIDGVVIHQMLQWHHMVSDTEPAP